MKKRTGEPWMPASRYAKGLSGVTVNLIVRDVRRSLAFHRLVLGATVVYDDANVAVLSGSGAEWLLHADHTYESHPVAATLDGNRSRGIGIEIRLHGRDPDAAEAEARRLGATVLSPASDRPHGLREAHILDPDGYLWVPDVPLPPPPPEAA